MPLPTQSVIPTEKQLLYVCMCVCVRGGGTVFVLENDKYIEDMDSFTVNMPATADTKLSIWLHLTHLCDICIYPVCPLYPSHQKVKGSVHLDKPPIYWRADRVTDDHSCSHSQLLPI